MKLPAREFSKQIRKDVDLVDFINDITKLINFSRYENALESASLTGQLDDITTTTLYTPSSAGLFRVSVYAVCTAAGTAGLLDITIGWTDDAQAQSSVVVNDLDLSGAGNAASYTLFIRSTATAITYAAAIGGKLGTPEYALYITVEEMVG